MNFAGAALGRFALALGLLVPGAGATETTITMDTSELRAPLTIERPEHFSHQEHGLILHIAHATALAAACPGVELEIAPAESEAVALELPLDRADVRDEIERATAIYAGSYERFSEFVVCATADFAYGASGSRLPGLLVGP